jgi:hypothetical protein
MKKQSIFLCSLLGFSAACWFTLNHGYSFHFLKNDQKVNGPYIEVTEQSPPQWKEIERALNNKGSVQGEVFKVTFPRSDLHVKVDRTTVEPSLALTSWIAFKPVGNETVMMGDLVLLEKEVAPVAQELIKNGIEVTALHNHLLGETPKIMYLHIRGHGNAIDLAKKMKQVLSLTKTPISSHSASPDKQVVWSNVETILGVKGTIEGDVLHITVPRKEQISEMNTNIPPSMGVATGINFQMIGDKAATTGDFVLVASEVNPVIKALTNHGIIVTAVHNHMLQESPRLLFLHFWGLDEPSKLATGLKEALNQTNSKSGTD